MPRCKRPQPERMHEMRPVVLFNKSAAERARETETAERTLQRKAEQFELHGMASLFPKEPAQSSETTRDLPPDRFGSFSSIFPHSSFQWDD